MTLWPIYIPSKGRATTAAFWSWAGRGVNVVVEPQEFEAYLARCQELESEVRIVSLLKNDQGIVYVRNQILRTLRQHNCRWGWMIDDDVSGFTRSVGDTRSTRGEKLAVKDALRLCQDDILSERDVWLGGMNYTHFAWDRQPGRKLLNRRVEVVVALNVAALPTNILYRDFPTKEDRDFCLQVLAAGGKILRSDWIGFSCPARGANAGGLQECYDSGVEEEVCQRMEKAWPGIVKVKSRKIRKKTDWDLDIDWKRAAQRSRQPSLLDIL